MRHEQQRALELAQGVLEPADRVDVEMVRRLVEQKQIRLGDERLAEQGPPPPAAGQLAERTIGRQRQPRHDHLDFLFEPPAVAFFELVLKRAQALERRRRLRRLHRRVVIARDERAELAEARRDLVEHRAIGRAWHLLVEPRHAQAGRAPDRARVGRLFAGYDPQQRRLARAVAADQADALAGLDAQVRVLEERQMAKGERDGVEGEQRQAGCEASVISGYRRSR